MIVSDLLSTKLVTRLNYGQVDGKEVIKNKSYGNVRPDAPLTALHTAATTITDLQTPTLQELYRVVEDAIFDDGQ